MIELGLLTIYVICVGCTDLPGYFHIHYELQALVAFRSSAAALVGAAVTSD